MLLRGFGLVRGVREAPVVGLVVLCGDGINLVVPVGLLRRFRSVPGSRRCKGVQAPLW